MEELVPSKSTYKKKNAAAAKADADIDRADNDNLLGAAPKAPELTGCPLGVDDVAGLVAPVPVVEVGEVVVVVVVVCGKALVGGGSLVRHDASEPFPTVNKSVLPPLPRPLTALPLAPEFSYPATSMTFVPAARSTSHELQSREDSSGSDITGAGTAKVGPPGTTAQKEAFCCAVDDGGVNAVSGQEICHSWHCDGVGGSR